MSSQPAVLPLLASGRIEEAAAIWTAFLRDQGQDNADGWFSLAGQYQVDGHRLAAEEGYRQLLRRYPGHGGALINLGCVLEDEDRIEEAIACYRQALAPPAVEKAAIHNLERLLGQHDCNQAIGTQIRLALAKRLTLSREAEAIRLYQEIIDDPATNSAIRADACRDLGWILGNRRRFAEASVLMEKCIALDPGGQLSNWTWTEFAVFYCLSGRGDQREVNRVVKTWAQRLPSPVTFPFPARKPGPVRIGFCSAAFGHGHAQDHFVNDLAPALIRRNVDAICYLLPGSSKQAWEIPVVDVSALSGAAAAARVRQDDPDCLITIDLLPMYDCGFYLYRPARFIASMSHAVASSGLVDGLLLDRWMMPPDAEDDFCEEILYLKTPGPFVSNLYMLASGGPLPAPPPCLARGHITFGSFNRPDKIDASTVALWAQAMHAVPGSRLYLRAGFFNDSEAHRIRALFAAAGIADRRIDIHGWSPLEDFLRGYGEIDIALDPLNFNGGLTTAQALWHGVPVIAMTGKLIVSRYSASILAAIDREEWIACDAGDWLRIVTGLAAAPDELSAWRTELRARLAASTVIDPDLMADNLLTALALHLPARS